MNDALKQFIFGSKETVYLSVTPSVGLELIQLDAGTKTVKNYLVRPLEYNESLKEIANITQFKDTVAEMLKETVGNAKCSVILSMPVVHFGTISLPLILGDEAVNEALISEVEQVYLFRRTEPLIRWMALPGNTGDMRRLLYAAVQKSEIEKIEAALETLGATVNMVEISPVSIIRALAFSGLSEGQMKENNAWNLMVVTSNGYYLCSMLNQMIVDYYEEPMPLKSFENEEAYSAMVSSAQLTLMNYPARYLYVVSETDLISAELLSHKIPFDGTKRSLENNIFKKESIVPVSLSVLPKAALQISMEAIGIGASNIISLPMQLNFASRTGGAAGDDGEAVAIEIGNFTINLSPYVAKKLALVISVFFIIISLIFSALVPLFLKPRQNVLNDVLAKLRVAEEEYKRYDSPSFFDAEGEIRNVMSYNRLKLMSYTALGESVPKGLWLTYFEVKGDGVINVKGQSYNIDDIYVFYKNLKDTLMSSKLKLQSLELVSKDNAVVLLTSDSKVIYSFEITNSTEAPKPPVQESKSKVKPEPEASPPPAESGMEPPPEAVQPDIGDDSGNPSGKSGSKVPAKQPALEPIDM